MSKPEYLLSDEDTLVQFDSINEMLDEDPKYLKEFCEAGIKSFTKFRDDFKESMHSRDLEHLRKAGHRIKPVAQMVGVQQINDLYNEAKDLLNDEKEDEVIEASVTNIQGICNRIMGEFKRQVEKL
jgi:HPt (histidine-containing phosphotransfer) domain-containing protein